MKIIYLIFAVVFPFVTFLLRDLPGPAFVAMILQVSIIGWPIATIWAMKTAFKTQDDIDKL